MTDRPAAPGADRDAVPAASASTVSVAAATRTALAALTAPELARIVDLVAVPEPAPGPQVRTVLVANHRGRVRLHADGRHEVLAGDDPVAGTDPLAFLPYPEEVADPGPDNAGNVYPDPARRLLSFLSDPDRSPDLAVVHTPRHYFPEEGGHRGEHGSLDVIQSRAPFLLSGAGVGARGVRHDSARVVDVMPTLLSAAGVSRDRHRDATGAPLDGTAREDLLTRPGAGRHVIGVLWDGAHCSDLLHLAATGELPGVARLLDHGVALSGGAVAEFPSVTLCNHTSALTGVGPGRHGVIGNVFHDRRLGRTINANDPTTWHRSAEWIRPAAATVFEVLAAARPGAVTLCINEAVDRGATVSTMARVRASGASGAGELDALLPPAEDSPFVTAPEYLADPYLRWCSRVDDLGVQQVLDAFADPAAAPALTWWSHLVTDAGNHAGGPRSEISRAALRDADRRLQALLDHLDRVGLTGQVTFLLTADHGFEAADETVRGSWRPALAAALDPLGIPWRDEGPGLIYFGK
ncbi:MAG: alkaline phosphatase family protein [Kineosporiaceae bacterium]